MDEKDKGIITNYIVNNLMDGAEEKIGGIIDQLVADGRLGSTNAEDLKKVVPVILEKIKAALK